MIRLQHAGAHSALRPEMNDLGRCSTIDLGHAGRGLPIERHFVGSARRASAGIRGGPWDHTEIAVSCIIPSRPFGLNIVARCPTQG